MYADVLGLSFGYKPLSFSQVSSAPITRLSVSLFVSDRGCQIRALVKERRHPREESSFTTADEWRVVVPLRSAARR